MLNLRLYRLAFLPAVLALIAAAFSLQPTPSKISSQAVPDPFSGTRVLVQNRQLAEAFPARQPGSQGDGELAQLVAKRFKQARFTVTENSFEARTVKGVRQLTNVVATKPGVGNGRIIVLAHRDALSNGAASELAPTSLMLELAARYQTRSLRRTLMLVSVSGGAGGGFAGAQRFAEREVGKDDVVMTVPNPAGSGTDPPLVLPWSDKLGLAPQQLRRLTADALYAESRLQPGGLSIVGQFARLALPLTLGEQGAVLGAGVPAVSISPHGERSINENAEIDASRIGAIGRTLVRTVGALDTARQFPAGAQRSVEIDEKSEIPEWAVRWLVAGLMLPVLVVAVDGYARARRKRQWVGRWLWRALIDCAPFAFALFFVVLLGAVGLMPQAPPQPTDPGVVPFDVAASGVLGGAILVVVAGFLFAWPILHALGPGETEGQQGGRGLALSFAFSLLTVLVWIANPYFAVLLLLPLHLWTLALDTNLRPPRFAALAVVIVSLLPLVAVVVYYSLAFALPPWELPWWFLLLVGGGHFSVLWLFAAAAVLGSISYAVATAWTGERGSKDPEEFVTRGPLGYAGPGSLGGTSSAIGR